jgi:hypothetical protein
MRRACPRRASPLPCSAGLEPDFDQTIMPHTPPDIRARGLTVLCECLADQFAPPPKVYLDRGMARAVHWPSNLQTALRHSKIMIQLLTPHYFTSAWCMAQHAQAREKLLGLAGLEHIWHHSRAHRCFAVARWSTDQIGLPGRGCCPTIGAVPPAATW